MKIVKIHFKQSIPVTDWSSVHIRYEAQQLQEFATNGPFIGEHRSCFALHHSQVSNEPLNYFVMNSKLSPDVLKLFPSLYIINPKIVSKDESSSYSVKEACMSFPFRTARHVGRYWKIRVQYQVPSLVTENGGAPRENGNLDTVEEDIEGIKAQIFQHEVDHSHAINIHGHKA